MRDGDQEQLVENACEYWIFFNSVAKLEKKNCHADLVVLTEISQVQFTEFPLPSLFLLKFTTYLCVENILFARKKKLTKLYMTGFFVKVYNLSFASQIHIGVL